MAAQTLKMPKNEKISRQLSILDISAFQQSTMTTTIARPTQDIVVISTGEYIPNEKNDFYFYLLNFDNIHAFKS